MSTFLPEIITVKGCSLCAEVMNLQYSNLISLAVVFCHPESIVSQQLVTRCYVLLQGSYTCWEKNEGTGFSLKTALLGLDIHVKRPCPCPSAFRTE